MVSLALHDFHQKNGAKFLEISGQEAVADYGDRAAEEVAPWESAGVGDLSYRARLCVLGADRVKFLNGQITNKLKDLQTHEGCYAAIVSAKGKIQSDLHIHVLENELLLEFEPGLGEVVQQRLDKYIIAEDAQVADVTPHYGLWTVQGPKAGDVIQNLGWSLVLPAKENSVTKLDDPALGEICVTNRARTQAGGYDLFIPANSMPTVAGQLQIAARKVGARFCGWQALETARIEAGLPRFGLDMDESNIVSEALGANALSYSKGCYIGQEVIARIRTYGQVAKALRGLRLPDGLATLPAKGDKIFLGDKEAGYITSAVASAHFKANLALGYVRREANQMGTELTLQSSSGKISVKIVGLPFNS